MRPDLVGTDAVPPAALAPPEEEVDGCQCFTRAAIIRRPHLVRRAEHLPVPPAFGVRLQGKTFDELRGTLGHWRGKRSRRDQRGVTIQTPPRRRSTRPPTPARSYVSAGTTTSARPPRSTVRMYCTCATPPVSSMTTRLPTTTLPGACASERFFTQ